MARFFADSLSGGSGGGGGGAAPARRYFGWQDFADDATAITPLEISDIDGGEIKLTNNNQGVLSDGNTTDNATTTPLGVNDTWNSTSNTIQFGGTGIARNDSFDIRAELLIESLIVENEVTIRLDFYEGLDGGGALRFSLRRSVYQETTTTGVPQPQTVDLSFFVGESIEAGSCEIIIETTKPTRITVVGWNFRIQRID